MVRMMQNDLLYMLPNQNGVRVCSLAIKELSHMAVQVVDEADAEIKTYAQLLHYPDIVSFHLLTQTYVNSLTDPARSTSTARSSSTTCTS
jgi:hypothetical protein